MAVDVGALSPLPRSFGPSPGGQQPPQQRKHGRQYSVQLVIGQNPLEHENGEAELQGTQLSTVPAQESCNDIPSSSQQSEHTRVEIPCPSLPVHPSIIVKTDHITSRSTPDQDETSSREPTQQGLSSEELFARRFGYGSSSHVSFSVPEPPTPPPQGTFPVSSVCSRSRSRQRRSTRFSDEEEGNLVVLPPPLLLRPRSFWHNTRDTALHTPSYQLVRRATFLAAGLSLDKPVSDLSALAVESRTTVGKVGGLGGSAGLPVGLGVFG